MQKSRWQKYRLVFGPGFILLGIYMSITETPFFLGTIVMTVGFVYTIRGLMVMKHGEERYKGDERTRKIGAYAAAYSWFFTILAISVIFWADYLGLRKFTGQEALGAVMLFMVASLILSRWHIARKGDVL